MSYITTGLNNGGVTNHYKFSYDSALGGPGGVEPARTNAVIAACESDYNLMYGWFGSSVNVTGMNVQVTTQSNGASWSGSISSSTIQLKAQGASYSSNPVYLRYLLIAEVVELFMLGQNKGWFQGGNEGSKGEGLSRFLSGQFLQQNGWLGIGIDASYAVANLWLNSPRADYVNNAPDDNGYDATNGCTTLFIYYLFSQLGYSINQIVAAASSTLTGVYKNLTGNSSDPFPLFKSILDLYFPSQTSSAVPGPNYDNPFPLNPAAYTGVWRSGSAPYYLWTDADESHFLAKWNQLSAQNLRLTDIEVTPLANGQVRWSGVWEQGTDAHYLWIDADWSHFQAKWQQLSAQNLRLVSFQRYNGLWAGVWRSGSDGYYLWVDADEAHFTAKWQQLAAQNLRLVDFDVYDVNGQRLWAGVWRSGSDGYYLWINADWSHFTAKWQQLAAQGLRLVGIRNYSGLWAGIWRSGTDGYYLWANVSESNFLAKWQQLAAQNLRLVDMDVVPLGVTAATGASSSLSAASGSTGFGGGSVDLASAPDPSSGIGGGSTDTPPETTPAIAASGKGGGSVETALSSITAASGSGGSIDAEPQSSVLAATNGKGGGSIDLASAPDPSSGIGGGSTDTPPETTPAIAASGKGGGSVDLAPSNEPLTATASSSMTGRESTA